MLFSTTPFVPLACIAFSAATHASPFRRDDSQPFTLVVTASNNSADVQTVYAEPASYTQPNGSVSYQVDDAHQNVAASDIRISNRSVPASSFSLSPDKKITTQLGDYTFAMDDTATLVALDRGAPGYSIDSANGNAVINPNATQSWLACHYDTYEPILVAAFDNVNSSPGLANCWDVKVTAKYSSAQSGTV